MHSALCIVYSKLSVYISIAIFHLSYIIFLRSILQLNKSNKFISIELIKSLVTGVQSLFFFRNYLSELLTTKHLPF